MMQPAEPTPMTTPAQRRKNNIRLGLILASIAVVIFIGFIVRGVLLGS